MSLERLRSVRPAAVAGSFYPAEPGRLRFEVDRFMKQASGAQPMAGALKALVVPHAGYVYSGSIAARAYAQLAQVTPAPQRVVLLGPSHHVDFHGLALPEAGALQTPLGVVPIDALAGGLIERFGQVSRSARAHQREHSLEVQLPFLQRVLPLGFAVLPLAVGRATPEEVAEVIEFLWDQPGTLVVVSTDLSHFLTAEEARGVDGFTARHIVAEDFESLGPDLACGHHPLAGLLLAARRRGFVTELIDLRNSADTAGEPDRVVGYGAFAVLDRKHHAAITREATSAEWKRRLTLLLQLARGSIAESFGGPPVHKPLGEPWLNEPGACFVSLHEDGDLRGCVGTSRPTCSLFEDVIDNARGVAFNDTRFTPLSRAELPRCKVSVTVLGERERVDCQSQAECLQKLRPGVDGLEISGGGRRALFIPQMWSELPEPAMFLGHLKRKAGFGPDEWPRDMKVWRFTAHYEEEA